MNQTDLVGDELNKLAAQYALCRANSVRQQVGPASVGWGLLGASQVAENQMIPALRRQPAAAGEQTGAWVAAVFSHNEHRARVFADANQIPSTAVNLADLLERRAIHAVYVSSDPRRHFPLVMAALLAGKHVLCEPPLALSVEEARSLVETATNRGLMLSVNFTARANPGVRVLRQLLLNDALGDVLGGAISNLTNLPTHRQTWRLQAPGGGVILDRTIHDVDLLRFLFRDEIATVYALRGQSSLAPPGLNQVEEELIGQVRLARQGIVIRLHDAFFLAHRPPTVVLDGTHQSVRIEYWSNSARLPALFLHRRQQATLLDLPLIDPFWLTIYEFQRSLRGAETLLATGQDGLRAAALAKVFYQALHEEKAVRLR
jgi:1,5-anhydro-D-fructose reductase (1,5-anhydro-D-mannitol-forming)